MKTTRPMPCIVAQRPCAAMSGLRGVYQRSTPWPPLEIGPHAGSARIAGLMSLPMCLVEPPQRHVIRALTSRQPQIRYLFATRHLQLSTRAHSRHEPIQPHAQQTSRVVSGAPGALLLSPPLAPPTSPPLTHLRTLPRIEPDGPRSNSSRLGGNIHICSRLIALCGI